MLVPMSSTGAQRLKRETRKKLLNRAEQLKLCPTLVCILRTSQEKQEAHVDIILSKYVYTH